MTKNEKEEILALADKLMHSPELGYKEFNTKKILVDYLTNKGFKIENECFETAFSISIGEGHPHIGLIAELDAIPTLGHPLANKSDNNAAHACGHFAQCTAMAGAMVLLSKEKFNGRITLFFTPAEEYTDIVYREKLIAEKKIDYIGGKLNMLTAGLFDDPDIFIHLHAMGEGPYQFSIGSNLAGFVYKKLIFKGKAAHAAMAPEMGINALNAYALFNSALNMLREAFDEKDTIRVHGFISEGGQTVNSIPEEVVYECYVRANNSKALLETAAKVDNAARSCANALGATCNIETSPGYLPLIQDEQINKVLYKQMLNYCNEKEIEMNVPSMAAGDVGDISVFKPTVQFGQGGFKGIPHGKNFGVADEELCYFKTMNVIVDSVLALLNDPDYIEKVVDDYEPRMNKESYLSYINTKN